MYKDIKLDKNLYKIAGKTFTQALSELDSNCNYEETELANLDAFERQLKRFGIKVSGENSDTVEKFFVSSSSAALFPEFVSRAVSQGIRDENILSEMVAAITRTNSYDYRSITSIPEDDDVTLKKVAEGAIIPTTEIRLNQSLVTLTKRGRMLSASYEAIKMQRIDLFAVTLRQIGAAIARAQLKDAILLVIEGAPNADGAEEIKIAGDNLAYSDLVNFWSKFEDMNLTTLLASPNNMSRILQFAEMRDNFSGDYMTSGKVKLPFGATLIKTTCLDDSKIIGLDKSCALEMVIAQDLSLESDKLIDRQMERTAITTVAGFSKIFTDASKVLSLV